jgi:hypothetical protein
MNETLKAIKERRSIRKFKADMPKKEDLQQIVEAGLYAASGMARGRYFPPDFGFYRRIYHEG